MRLLACGSRRWTDKARVRLEIERLVPYVLIHGAAVGLDTIVQDQAMQWARDTEHALLVIPFPVLSDEWLIFGKRAGPMRNAKMLRRGRPDQGLAFGPLWRVENEQPRHTGTGDMVERMLKVKLPVRWIETPEAEALDLICFPDEVYR